MAYADTAFSMNVSVLHGVFNKYSGEMGHKNATHSDTV